MSEKLSWSIADEIGVFRGTGKGGSTTGLRGRWDVSLDWWWECEHDLLVMLARSALVSRCCHAGVTWDMVYPEICWWQGVAGHGRKNGSWVKDLWRCNCSMVACMALCLDAASEVIRGSLVLDLALCVDMASCTYVVSTLALCVDTASCTDMASKGPWGPNC
jgi:hypothetical protein